MSVRLQIEDPSGVQDARAISVFRSIKAIVDRITARSQKMPIKTLGADATLAGAINKINEVIKQLQE